MPTSMEGDLCQNVDGYFNLEWIKISPGHCTPWNAYLLQHWGKICIQHSPFMLLSTLYSSSVPLSRKGSATEVGRKVPLLEFNGLFFYAKRNNRVFGTVPSLLKHCSLFSHPLSLLVTWRTLVVLGFYLILVSGGRTHPFFMVYMHTTTNSKELVPVPKRRFAFAHFPVAFL